MGGPAVARWLAAVATWSADHRRRVGVVTLVLIVVSAVLGLGLRVNTDRYDMVAADHEYQAKMITFFERFGHPDAVAIVVLGPVDDRRHAIDELRRELDGVPLLTDRVLARADPQTVAETLLLQAPERLATTPAAGEQLARIEYDGLSAVADALAQQMTHALDGTDPTQANGDDVLASATAQLDVLTDVARSLSAVLRGELDPSRAFDQPLADLRPADAPKPSGVDNLGYLTAGPDAHLVIVFPPLQDHEVESLREVVDPIRSVCDRVESGHENVELLLTGIPVLTLDEHGFVARGSLESSVASGLGIVALLLLAFRSVRSIVLTLVPLVLGMVVTCGAIRLTYGELNPITAGMFALLLGLGVDFSVHLIVRYHERRRAGATADEALAAAYQLAGPGVVTGAVTTILVFLTITQAEFSAFAQLGFNSAVGIAIILSMSFVALPALLRDNTGRGEPPPLFPGTKKLPSVVRAAPRLWLVIGLGVAIAGASVATRVSFNSRYFDFLPQAHDSSRALAMLETTQHASPIFAFASAPSIDDARKLATRLRALPTVGHVDTPSDLFPELDQSRIAALRQLAAEAADSKRDRTAKSSPPLAERVARSLRDVVDAFDEVCFAIEQAGRDAGSCRRARDNVAALRQTVLTLDPGAVTRLEQLDTALRDIVTRATAAAHRVASSGAYDAILVPAVFRHRFVARDDSGAVALFIYPRDSIWSSANAEAFADEVGRVATDAAGHAITMHVHTRMIVKDFRQAAGIAAALVLLVLLFDFRRLSDALLAAFPVLVGWSWMLGTLVAANMSLNAASIVALPLVLGIGVDAGVHMMHRCRQSAKAHDGVARLDDLVTGTGSAVVIASLTTIIGFGGLMVPDHGGMQSLGAMMMLGTACSLVASVVVLPALLVWIGRAR